MFVKKGAIDAQTLKIGDKLKYHYGVGNINNQTVEFRGLIDDFFAVFRHWQGFKGWIYYGETSIQTHLNVFLENVTLKKKEEL